MKLQRILLIAGILLLVNLLARDYFFRLDITQDKQYTLSNATTGILQEITEPVTITAYFTEDLPQQLVKTREDFRDLLNEYSTRSRGMVNYEFIDPSDNPESEQEARQNGISPITISVREKDEAVQKQAYLGAVLKSETGQDIIPLIQPQGPMEYQVTTAIKKIADVDKATVGLIQGNGEPGLQDLGLLYQSLSILYTVETIDLSTTTEISPRFTTLLWIKPTDSIGFDKLAPIDRYLANGGNLVLAYDQVDGDFQTAQGSIMNNGLSPWLSNYGLQVQEAFVLDARCGEVQVQQRQGFFSFASSVKFPYFPLISDFPEHPITDGLEQITFQLASPLSYTGDTASSFTPLIVSSENSSVQSPPLFFDVQRQWSANDFPNSHLTLGGLLSKNNDNGTVANIAVYTDGDVPLGAQGGGQTPDNVSLIANTVDFLSDDTGLMELRTKGITTRPIEELEDGERSRIKWFNFLLPILLVIGYGVFRFQRNRRIRIRRMEQIIG